VSPNKDFGTREGQSLPEVRRLVDHARRWSESYEYPWEQIRRVWMAYWEHSKPLLLEKSPPNLIRGRRIAEYFSPVRFIALMRDPYIQCEALMRRDKLTSRQAAERTLQCLRHQRRNLLGLRDIIVIRYEDLVRDPAGTATRLLRFLPELQHVDVNQTFSAHNQANKALPIVDMNMGKIERMSSRDRRVVTDVFMPHESLLEGFGYELRPGR